MKKSKRAPSPIPPILSKRKTSTAGQTIEGDRIERRGFDRMIALIH